MRNLTIDVQTRTPAYTLAQARRADRTLRGKRIHHGLLARLLRWLGL